MQRWKKRIWTGSLVSGAVLLIVAAVLMGAVRLVDLAAPRYRQTLANYMTEAIDQPVEVGRIGMSWRGLRPTADLAEVMVLDPDNGLPVFELREIHVPFSWTALLRGQFKPAEVILAGMAVTLEWRADGSLGVQGIQMLAGGGESAGELDLADTLAQLRQLGRVIIHDSQLAWQEFGEPIGLTQLTEFNAELELGMDANALSVVARLPGSLGEWLTLEVSVEGDPGQPENLQTQLDMRAENLLIQGWIQPVMRPGLELRGDPTDVQLSSVWKGLQLQTLQLDLKAPVQSLWQEDSKINELPGLTADVSLQAREAGWQASINSLQYQSRNDVGPATHGSLSYEPLAGGFGDQLSGELDVLRISDLLAWSSVLALGEGMPLPAASEGQLEQLRFSYSRLPGQSPDISLSAGLKRLSMPETAPLPGLEGINGQLSYENEIAALQLNTQAGRLSLSQLFGEPVPLDELQTSLTVQASEQGWQLATQSLSVQTGTVTAHGALKFDIFNDGRSPAIDLILDFSASDVRPVKPLIPLQPALPTAVGDWLRGAILAGHVPSGEMVLRGALADFPYVGSKKASGEFRVEFDVRDAELEYASDWPRVSKVDGHAIFAGRSMHINARSGEILGVPVQDVQARIKNFKTPLLRITGRVEADLEQQLQFLAASPLKDNYQGLLDSLQISGPGRLDLDLRIPLGEMDNTRVSGDIQLQGASLRFAGFPHPVTQVSGPVRFTEGGLSGEGIQGRFLELPATATLIPEQTAAGVATRLNAQLQLTMPQDEDKLRQLLAVPMPVEKLSGQTTIQITSLFDSTGTTHPIRLSSDLQGMAVALGAPLAKSAADQRDLRVAIIPAAERLEVEWHYADALHGRVELLGQEEGWLAHRGVLILGSQAQSTQLPAGSGWVVTGDLPVVDLEAMPVGGGGKVPEFQVLDVHVGLLKVAGQKMRNIRMRLDPQRQKLLLTGVDSEGSLSWQPQGKRTMLTADFKRLSLTLPEQAGSDASETRKPPMDPAILPGLSLSCEQFILGDEVLGSLRLRAQPIEHGLRIDLLDLKGKHIELRGGGEWLRINGQSNADLLVNFNSDKIESLLKASGYAESIKAEKADVFADLHWTPRAEGLGMQSLNGKLGFEIENGSLLAVEPGAGRVLSLLSFYALPRRLTLDFSDVMGQGTAFDKLRGQFDVEQGNAHTKNLKVESPSMEIKVRGRVGLAARDYDQTVTIEPKLSSNIAIAGAVFGGPVLGLGLWLAQELLDQPFEQVATLTYHVGGTWDEPDIKPIKAEARAKPGKGKPGIGKTGSAKPGTGKPAARKSAPDQDPAEPSHPGADDPLPVTPQEQAPPAAPAGPRK